MGKTNKYERIEKKAVAQVESRGAVTVQEICNEIEILLNDRWALIASRMKQAKREGGQDKQTYAVGVKITFEMNGLLLSCQPELTVPGVGARFKGQEIELSRGVGDLFDWMEKQEIAKAVKELKASGVEKVEKNDGAQTNNG